MKLFSALFIASMPTVSLAAYTGPILKSITSYKTSTHTVVQTCEIYQHSKIQTVEVGDVKTTQTSDSHIETQISPIIAKAAQGIMNTRNATGATEASYFAYKANDDGTIEKVDLGSNANGVVTTNGSLEASQLKSLIHFSCMN